jgi:hypothetical protein
MEEEDGNARDQDFADHQAEVERLTTYCDEIVTALIIANRNHDTDVAEIGMLTAKNVELAEVVRRFVTYAKTLQSQVSELQAEADVTPETTCTTHEWSDRGTPGNYWRECWLCGASEEVDSRFTTETFTGIRVREVGQTEDVDE